jgi:hypothetical protein
MVKNKFVDTMSKVVEILTPLSPEERQRVIGASLTLLGDPNIANKQVVVELKEEEANTLSLKASLWAKQNEISKEELDQVFLVSEELSEVIASDVPGKGKKEKTFNAYVLTGVLNLLSTGNSNFDDKSARQLCKLFGCFDEANHAAFFRDKGNDFAGSKDRGWALTAPGLKRGATLVKELNK